MIGSSKPQGTGRYKIVWSRDPALRQLELPDQLPDGATQAEVEARDKQVVELVKAHVTAHRIARENQNWEALRVGKGEPTMFACRWIPDLIRGRWQDRMRREVIGVEEGRRILLLLALVDVENFGGRKFKEPVDTEEWGRMAPVTFLDELRRVIKNDDDPAASDALYRALVTDLSEQVYEMEATTGPL